jgi:hypothetical protein
MKNLARAFLGILVASFVSCPNNTPIDPPAPPPTGTYPWAVWTGENITVPASKTGATYYVDATNGNNTNTGNTATTAFKTIAKALEGIAAGDTVLIRKGLYREGISIKNGATGTATKPITFGSFGDGEVIVDGSNKTGVWENVNSTIWRTKKSDWQAGQNIEPIAVVVNDVALKQVTQGQNGSTAPQVGLAGVSSGSGKWHNGASYITADMGSIDPNKADIVVPKFSQDQEHVFFYAQEYITYKGLTIRGGGSNGIWGYGNHITVESCNIKFNGKAAVSFLPSDLPGFEGTDNAVLTSNIYQNVLINWPRGNNYNAEAGGSWPGTLAWSGNARGIARGNIVHMNGGEGIASYGTFKGNSSGILVEQNVVSDNWSVDVYVDNHPNAVVRNNFIYNHPIDYNPTTTNFLYVGEPYPYSQLGKYSVGIGIGDEYYGIGTNLTNTQVYNNIISGTRTGILDYGEGTDALQTHGLKNTLIANNTIIMPYGEFPNTGGTYGIKLRDNRARDNAGKLKSPVVSNNLNTIIANNIIYGNRNDPLIFSELTGKLEGITLKNNLYFSPIAKPFGSADEVNGSFVERAYSLSEWKTNTGSETNSLFQDPQLEDVTHFATAAPTPYSYLKAKPKTGSPALSGGTPQSFSPAVNIELLTRAVWNIGAF